MMLKNRKKIPDEAPGGVLSHPIPAFGVFLFMLMWNVIAFVGIRPDCDLISFPSYQAYWKAEAGNPSGVVLTADEFKGEMMHYKGEYQFNGKKYSFSCRGPQANPYKVNDVVRMEIYKNNPFYARIQGTFVHDSYYWPEANFRRYLLFGGVGLAFLLGLVPSLILIFWRYFAQKTLERKRKQLGLSVDTPNTNSKRVKAFKFFLITLTLWYLVVSIGSVI
ncbi:MAG: hypothetical protein Q4G59_00910, partial [Planctomycetia bacterium]|nr:hypothetical protein [Planctomycetia bacterium]